MVARQNHSVLYYEDVEEGFDIGWITPEGYIIPARGNQWSLCFAIRQWLTNSSPLMTYEEARNALAYCLDRHATTSPDRPDDGFELVDSCLPRSNDASWEKVFIALHFWDGWIDASNHQWQHYFPILQSDWPILAREIAADLRCDSNISAPLVFERFRIRPGCQNAAYSPRLPQMWAGMKALFRLVSNWQDSRRWRRDHIASFTKASNLDSEGVTVFQRQLLDAVDRIIPGTSYELAAHQDGSKHFVTSIPGADAKLFIYETEAEILGGPREHRFEEWDFRTSDDLIGEVIRSLTDHDAT